ADGTAVMKKLAIVSICCFGLYGQAAKTANERYQTPAGREAVAKALGATDRDERQKPQELVDAMQLRAGMTVADIGTGVGDMLPFLSKAVGPQGRVLAEDIFDGSLAQPKPRAPAKKIANVRSEKGTEPEP